MKRLWKTIPPCLSDVLGFEMVVSATEGMGIVDDPSKYKPLRLGKASGKKDFARGGRHFEVSTHGSHEEKGRQGRKIGVRVVNSDIRDPDIIRGTEEKVMQAFEKGSASFQPSFVLLSHAPSSSMIGSDLDTCAARISESSGLQAANVNLDGERDYLYGISRTLEAMGKLLLEKADTIPHSVNLLGCNAIDWTEGTLAAADAWLAASGFQVISRWGMKETTANLRRAAAASVNLVVNVSGLRLARYMEAEYGVPYVAGAPFGVNQCALLEGALAEHPAAEPNSIPDTGELEVLIIGEQLLGNALRKALLDRGSKGIRVVSFFDMDKSLMMPGDAKLISEDELAELLGTASLRLVFGDPDYLPVTDRELAWIALPNYGNQTPVDGIANFNMAGKSFDEWLNTALLSKGWNV